MSTYNAIRYNVDYAKAGSLKLLSTQTASASASISFTTGIDSTYDEYWFIFNNIHPATGGADFTFQGSTNGGSSYGITTTSTFFGASHGEGDAGGQVSYTTSMDLAQSTSFIPLNNDVGADADQQTSGFLKLYNPSSTTYVKHFMARSNRADAGDYTVDCFCAGYLNSTSAIDAIQFKFDSGDIDDGTIQLFGVKQ
jgi:hypothetical protein